MLCLRVWKNYERADWSEIGQGAREMIWIVLTFRAGFEPQHHFPVDPSLSANSNGKRINPNGQRPGWPIACNVAKVAIVTNVLLELWRWFLVFDHGDCWFLTVLIFAIKNWFLTVTFCYKQCHNVTFCYLEVSLNLLVKNRDIFTHLTVTVTVAPWELFLSTSPR